MSIEYCIFKTKYNKSNEMLGITTKVESVYWNFWKTIKEVFACYGTYFDCLLFLSRNVNIMRFQGPITNLLYARLLYMSIYCGKKPL